MERYLLFDAGCSVCNQLAEAIEEAAAGKLQAVSVRDLFDRRKSPDRAQYASVRRPSPIIEFGLTYA